MDYILGEIKYEAAWRVIFLPGREISRQRFHFVCVAGYGLKSCWIVVCWVMNINLFMLRNWILLYNSGDIVDHSSAPATNLVIYIQVSLLRLLPTFVTILFLLNIINFNLYNPPHYLVILFSVLLVSQTIIIVGVLIIQSNKKLHVNLDLSVRSQFLPPYTFLPPSSALL